MAGYGGEESPHVRTLWSFQVLGGMLEVLTAVRRYTPGKKQAFAGASLSFS